MSINPSIVVVGITFLRDGSARLALEPSDPTKTEDSTELIVDPPLPTDINYLLESAVWSTSGMLMLGQEHIGNRKGIVHCKIWEGAITRALQRMSNK